MKKITLLFSSTLIFSFLFMSDVQSQDYRSDIERVRSVQDSYMHTRLNERITRIVHTPDFVRSASVTLNALILSNSLTDYLNDVNNLNNPTNDDLGFSLSHSIEDLLIQYIKTGKKQKGFPRVMEIARNMVQNPLVQSFTSAIPVVNSLSSVVELVSSFAIGSDEIPTENVSRFREEVSRYVQHYQGLAEATNAFQGTVFAIKERTQELDLILRIFTEQRIEHMFPQNLAQAQGAEQLRNILLDIYNKDRVEDKVREILGSYTTQSKYMMWESALNDPLLTYPDYAITEARFLLDELLAITEEYVIAINNYQDDLEMVLEKSKDLGDSDKIDRKVNFLRDKLATVEEAFLNAVHVQEVDYRFRAMLERSNNELMYK